MPRRIRRIAALQDYSNRPWQLKDCIPEVAAAGYDMVMLAAFFGDEPYLEDLCEEAGRHGLDVMAFTGFQKYNEAWLKAHPDQVIVFNADADAVDQDHLGLLWGCPFNPDFQQKYFDFLEFLGRIPNMAEVLINDEAFIGDAPDHLACYCAHCRADWRREFGSDMPRPPFPDTEQRAAFIKWRFRRWNEAHGKMQAVLNRHHPVKAIFQASPYCCLEANPWVTGVDLSGMIEAIDGVMTDPYYTFHLAWGAGPYHPLEIYLSEVSRYLYGLAGDGKTLELCVQGFSHPTFVRPLDRRDGWWSRVIPLALGIDGIMAYTYRLQRVSPVLETYEASFRLDSWFAGVKPLDYVAVVDSVETQAFHLDAHLAADRGDATWHYGYLMKVGEVMRHHGYAYVYLPGRKLESEDLTRWPVIALPGVSCLSRAARERLQAYVQDGGILVAFGETATRDENGRPLRDDFLAEVFGVTALKAVDEARELTACAGGEWAFSAIEWPDEITAGYMGGAMMPVAMLTHSVEVETAPAIECVAAFRDGAAPAVTINDCGQGKGVFCAGVPTRTVQHPRFELPVLNFVGQIVGTIVERLAGGRNPLRVTGFPPVSPIHRVRPVDHRRIPTVEVFPCLGENSAVMVVASYFMEEFDFSIQADIPPGKRLKEARELLADRIVDDLRIAGGVVEIPVHIGCDDFLKVYALVWEE